LGVSRYELDVGKIFGAVPYGLLKKHLGNEMIFMPPLLSTPLIYIKSIPQPSL
tara:strand:- start:112 stop:270 length:159 start_codon:yes stop_codon:yes gene_type:complete